MTEDAASTKATDAAVAQILEAIGLDDGFIRELETDPSDWSFIIKICALIEGAVTHALAHRLGDERLEQPMSYLTLADKRGGKVAFLRAMDLIQKESIVFINALAELRNQLIHGIHNIRFEFAKAANCECSPKVAEAYKGLGMAICKDCYGRAPTKDDVRIGMETYEAAPRILLMQEVRWVVAQLYLVADEGRLNQEIVTDMRAYISRRVEASAANKES